uniref:tRNA:m(4)X modification enzyme TRM13 homolog n=1 Tax=Fragaria vesca subsp. vesca TaxID=101020 RepID=UPI0005C869CF|nr:PREDICTED: tRNA:m(4)X modification enzyme TRM13 homolog [Fragaria vesca subsp. vesca]XP_011467056.1 PREDICTED: tRNA:m(4)X modification enzyme TRM13 homolog [Fragaria vesca subsp. vesca]XP_011467060.1 PREDICTED: tRNA:m(4)X modification enzyme TRM13 homolog [Fragaria vesca subsp. vesca]XP_011467065.1 PREDICTED: tRNA:m(4)X modification enzyme TRM13 homolog [Fragaria vesca subsp. vesca]
MDNRCKFWLPKKKRFCANVPLSPSLFCGNHTPRSNSQWIPCPIDPSHSVLEENLEGHLRRCPLLKQVESLTHEPFYQKGINAGQEEDQQEIEAVGSERVEDSALPDEPKSGEFNYILSEMKRTVYSMSLRDFYKLVEKIESVHKSICKDICESYKVPEACGMWINREVDRKLPFQEKHVMQQVSILGNMEEVGVIKSSVAKERADCDDGNGFPVRDDCDYDNGVPAVVEFGAGRGYLTQMLADCYGIKRVFLVERKSYKLKADRSLRQKERLILQRLRIDIEDLNLNAVGTLRGGPYIAIGKHLCGPATDLTLRCCLGEQSNQSNGGGSVNPNLRGLAIATCCHHLCQWKHYINKKYILDLGITKEEFHVIIWFTSWAVDADHGTDLPDVTDCGFHLESIEKKQCDGDNGVEDVVRNMKSVERAALGFMCKQIIDMGRLMWMKEHGLEAQFVKYVPSTVSPENHLLIAKSTKLS